MRTKFLIFCFVISCTCIGAQPLFDLQGHRGCRALMPENTIPGFLKAVEMGFTTLEMDVVITADSQIVLSHEPWMSHVICSHPDGRPVKRKEAKRLNLYRMSNETIRQYDCGLRPHPDFPNQVKMKAIKPTLEMVVNSVQSAVLQDGHRMPEFNIELKSKPAAYDRYHPAPDRFVELVVKKIRGLGIEETTTLQSFDLNVLEELNKVKDRKFDVSYLISMGRSIDKLLNRLTFMPDILSPNYKLVSEDMVDACHQRNIRIIPWTINDPVVMEKLKAWGCDGGITDGMFADSIAGDSSNQNALKRKVIKLANILPLATQPGTAAVRICIDRSGKVVSATYDYEKSTFKKEKYAKRVEEIAKQYEFEANSQAPEMECGNLKLVFKGGRSLRSML